LEERWGDRTDKLSGGMQQRLQLATSLVHDPSVIVLDEPFAGLDPVAVASLSETLRLRARDGRTVLFSSHQLDLVQDLCQDIAMVDHGRTVLLGSVARLRASSGRRQLRLHVEAPNRDWLLAYPNMIVVNDEADLRSHRGSTRLRCWTPQGQPAGWSTSGSTCLPSRSCSWPPPTGPGIRRGFVDGQLVAGHSPGR
jgi:ABC-type multidrug transport system ATPase subunit